MEGGGGGEENVPKTHAKTIDIILYGSVLARGGARGVNVGIDSSPMDGLGYQQFRGGQALRSMEEPGSYSRSGVPCHINHIQDTWDGT